MRRLLTRALRWLFITLLWQHFVGVLIVALRDMVWTTWYGQMFPLQPGAKVTVVYTDWDFKSGITGKVTAIVRARVSGRLHIDGSGNNGDSVWMRGVERPFKARLIVVPFADQGVVWCWGWTGAPARALRVTKALS